MTRLIDISMPLRPGMPAWPGSPGVRYSNLKSITAGDDVNATDAALDVHSGTHVDAPLHFIGSGAAVETIEPARTVGAAHVVDTGDADPIDSRTLESSGVPAGTTRLLLKTVNSRRDPAAPPGFDPDYCALSPDGAEWIVDRGIELVGIDALSIQKFNDPPDAHLTLLRAGVVILEGLTLAEAPVGECELICLPLRMAGIEAAPARAVLRVEG